MGPVSSVWLDPQLVMRVNDEELDVEWCSVSIWHSTFMKQWSLLHSYFLPGILGKRVLG